MIAIKRTKALKSSNQDDVDITPMLDVVFILLIFFIVTASFVQESGVAVNKPPPHAPDNSISQPIVLEIGADDQIRIQNRVVPPTSVKATMIRVLAEDSSASVSVRLHPLSTTKAMIAAVDGLKSANVALPPLTLFSS